MLFISRSLLRKYVKEKEFTEEQEQEDSTESDFFPDNDVMEETFFNHEYAREMVRAYYQVLTKDKRLSRCEIRESFFGPVAREKMSLEIPMEDGSYKTLPQ